MSSSSRIDVLPTVAKAIPELYRFDLFACSPAVQRATGLFRLSGFEGPTTMRSNARIGVVVAMATAIVLAIAASSVRSEISGRDGQALSTASLIYVATVRKDGNQSKAAPVWFTTSADNNAILIQTGPDSWKAKRIKRGSLVLVWIGSATGPAFIGRAEITSDAAVQNKILDDFRQKYWENRVMGVGPSRAKFDSGDRVAIKIAPVRDLPDGFSSNPGAPPPIPAPPSAPSRSP
jgi:general stress protein 26